MQRIAGILVFVVGLALLFWGVNSSNSAGSQISRVFTGAPTDKSIFLIIGGVIAAIAGAGMAFFNRPRP